jgi:hypothetical protein
MESYKDRLKTVKDTYNKRLGKDEEEQVKEQEDAEKVRKLAEEAKAKKKETEEKERKLTEEEEAARKKAAGGKPSLLDRIIAFATEPAPDHSQTFVKYKKSVNTPKK